jgi:hypothetical protein
MARRGRPFVVAWRDEDTEDALRRAYRSERDPALRPRLQALWLPNASSNGGLRLERVPTRYLDWAIEMATAVAAACLPSICGTRGYPIYHRVDCCERSLPYIGR